MPGLSKQDEEDFEAERDMETIIRAAEIQADSKRLRRAKKMAEKKMKALSKATES